MTYVLLCNRLVRPASGIDSDANAACKGPVRLIFGADISLVIPLQAEMRTLRHHLRATYQREAVYYSDKRRKAESSLRDATEEVCVCV